MGQAFALKYPKRCLSLILADTVSEVGDELRIILEAWLSAARAGDAEAFFAATVPWNFSPEFVTKRYKLLDYPAVVRLSECFLEVDFTAQLGKIKCPTCIIVGSADLLKGPAYAAILKTGIPHAEYHLLHGAGHASCWERPQEFNTTVLGFLAKHAS